MTQHQQQLRLRDSLVLCESIVLPFYRDILLCRQVKGSTGSELKVSHGSSSQRPLFKWKCSLDVDSEHIRQHGLHVLVRLIGNG